MAVVVYAPNDNCYYGCPVEPRDHAAIMSTCYFPIVTNNKHICSVSTIITDSDTCIF